MANIMKATEVGRVAIRDSDGRLDMAWGRAGESKAGEGEVAVSVWRFRNGIYIDGSCLFSKSS